MFEKIKDLFQSPRFISFYWQAGITVIVSFLTLISDSIPNLGLSDFITIMTISIISQITKAISNFSMNKKMGFSKKNYE